MLLNIFDSLILEICEFLWVNRDMRNIRMLSRFTKGLSDKYGYVRRLRITGDWPKLKVTNSVRRVDIINVSNPILKVSFAKKVIFSACLFDDTPIILNERVEELYITDSKSKKIFIDWGKIPNLKKLILLVNDIRLCGIEACKKLETVHIIIRNIGKVRRKGRRCLPICLSSLPNLSCILSNLPTRKNTEFTSTRMKSCIVP